MSNNNEHWHSDFGFAGPHMTLYHHHFQMVDSITINCKRAMKGLNPHALKHEPETINNTLSSEAKEERNVQAEEWTTPRCYARRNNDRNPHDNNVGRKTCDSNEEDKNSNRHNEFHEKDSDEEEEEEEVHHDVRNDDDKVKTSNKTEELTEKEYEQECFNLSIDERACNNLYDVCLNDLTNEEKQFTG